MAGPLRLGLWSALCVLSSLIAARPTQAQGCTGCTPLTDLGGGTYRGEEGGLYPGGANDLPAGHAAALLHAARAVVPRNGGGVPDPDGVIGVLSVGASVFGEQWREVSRRLERDTGVGGHVVLVQGAINGGAARLLADPLGPYWPVLDGRLAAAGIAHEQVQVAFLETSTPPVPPLPFPQSAERLRDELAGIVRLLRQRLPNLRVAFVTSHPYAGHSNIWLSEPTSYEDGFGVKWLIEDQINGDPSLEFDPRRGAVLAPVLAWGPYLWANGTTPRSDGLTWQVGDFESDGYHPSAAGEDKAAGLYEQFFASSAAAAAIFRPRAGTSRSAQPVERDAGLDASQPNLSLGAALELDVFLPALSAILAAPVAPYAGTISYAKLALEPTSRVGQVEAVGVTDTSWDEATITAANAPAFDGIASAPCGLISSELLAEWNVTEWVGAATTQAGGMVSLGLRKVSATELASAYAVDAGRPGWLSVTVDEHPGGSEAFCPALPTSNGAPALLATTGSASLAAGDLRFQVADAAAFALVLPLLGTAPVEQILAGGDLCVGGAFTRLPLVQADAGGRASFSVDWSAPATHASAGDTRVLQAVFRDAVTAGYRTTSAVVVTFRP